MTPRYAQRRGVHLSDEERRERRGEREPEDANRGEPTMAEIEARHRGFPAALVGHDPMAASRYAWGRADGEA